MYTVYKMGSVLRHDNDTTDNPLIYRKKLSAQIIPPSLQLLERLYRTIIRGYAGSLSITADLPHALTTEFRSDMLAFASASGRRLGEVSRKAVQEKGTPREKIERFSKPFTLELKRLSGVLEKHEKRFQTYLSLCEDGGYQSFLFLSERGETTCEQCSSHHGELFTSEELAQEHLLPPLHPNCRCRVVGLDSAAQILYDKDKEALIAQLDGVFDALGDPGGVFVLDHSFSVKGITLETLLELQPRRRGIIVDGSGGSQGWQDKLWRWFTGQSTMSLVNGLFEHGEAFFADATEDAGRLGHCRRVFGRYLNCCRRAGGSWGAGGRHGERASLGCTGGGWH